MSGRKDASEISKDEREGVTYRVMGYYRFDRYYYHEQNMLKSTPFVGHYTLLHLNGSTSVLPRKDEKTHLIGWHSGEERGENKKIAKWRGKAEKLCLLETCRYR